MYQCKVCSGAQLYQQLSISKTATGVYNIACRDGDRAGGGDEGGDVIDNYNLSDDHHGDERDTKDEYEQGKTTKLHTLKLVPLR